MPYPVANRNFSIHKQEGGWDSVALEVIEDATKEGRGADVGAVVLGEGEFRGSWPSRKDALFFLARKVWLGLEEPSGLISTWVFCLV